METGLIIQTGDLGIVLKQKASSNIADRQLCRVLLSDQKRGN